MSKNYANIPNDNEFAKSHLTASTSPHSFPTHSTPPQPATSSSTTQPIISPISHNQRSSNDVSTASDHTDGSPALQSHVFTSTFTSQHRPHAVPGHGAGYSDQLHNQLHHSPPHRNSPSYDPQSLCGTVKRKSPSASRMGYSTSPHHHKTQTKNSPNEFFFAQNDDYHLDGDDGGDDMDSGDETTTPTTSPQPPSYTASNSPHIHHQSSSPPMQPRTQHGSNLSLHNTAHFNSTAPGSDHFAHSSSNPHQLPPLQHPHYLHHTHHQHASTAHYRPSTRTQSSETAKKHATLPHVSQACSAQPAVHPSPSIFPPSTHPSTSHSTNPSSNHTPQYTQHTLSRTPSHLVNNSSTSASPPTTLPSQTPQSRSQTTPNAQTPRNGHPSQNPNLTPPGPQDPSPSMQDGSGQVHTPLPIENDRNMDESSNPHISSQSGAIATQAVLIDPSTHFPQSMPVSQGVTPINVPISSSPHPPIPTPTHPTNRHHNNHHQPQLTLASSAHMGIASAPTSFSPHLSTSLHSPVSRHQLAKPTSTPTHQVALHPAYSSSSELHTESSHSTHTQPHHSHQSRNSSLSQNPLSTLLLQKTSSKRSQHAHHYVQALHQHSHPHPHDQYSSQHLQQLNQHELQNNHNDHNQAHSVAIHNPHPSSFLSTSSIDTSLQFDQLSLRSAASSSYMGSPTNHNSSSNDTTPKMPQDQQIQICHDSILTHGQSAVQGAAQLASSHHHGHTHLRTSPHSIHHTTHQVSMNNNDDPLVHLPDQMIMLPSDDHLDDFYGIVSTTPSLSYTTSTHRTHSTKRRRIHHHSQTPHHTTTPSSSAHHPAQLHTTALSNHHHAHVQHTNNHQPHPHHAHSNSNLVKNLPPPVYSTQISTTSILINAPFDINNDRSHPRSENAFNQNPLDTAPSTQQQSDPSSISSTPNPTILIPLTPSQITPQGTEYHQNHSNQIQNHSHTHLLSSLHYDPSPNSGSRPVNQHPNNTQIIDSTAQTPLTSIPPNSVTPIHRTQSPYTSSHNSFHPTAQPLQTSHSSTTFRPTTCPPHSHASSNSQKSSHHSTVKKHASHSTDTSLNLSIPLDLPPTRSTNPNPNPNPNPTTHPAAATPDPFVPYRGAISKTESPHTISGLINRSGHDQWGSQIGSFALDGEYVAHLHGDQTVSEADYTDEETSSSDDHIQRELLSQNGFKRQSGNQHGNVVATGQTQSNQLVQLPVASNLSLGSIRHHNQSNSGYGKVNNGSSNPNFVQNHQRTSASFIPMAPPPGQLLNNDSVNSMSDIDYTRPSSNPHQQQQQQQHPQHPARADFSEAHNNLQKTQVQLCPDNTHHQLSQPNLNQPLPSAINTPIDASQPVDVNCQLDSTMIFLPPSNPQISQKSPSGSFHSQITPASADLGTSGSKILTKSNPSGTQSTRNSTTASLLKSGFSMDNGESDTDQLHPPHPTLPFQAAQMVIGDLSNGALLDLPLPTVPQCDSVFELGTAKYYDQAINSDRAKTSQAESEQPSKTLPPIPTAASNTRFALNSPNTFQHGKSPQHDVQIAALALPSATPRNSSPNRSHNTPSHSNSTSNQHYQDHTRMSLDSQHSQFHNHPSPQSSQQPNTYSVTPQHPRTHRPAQHRTPQTTMASSQSNLDDYSHQNFHITPFNDMLSNSPSHGDDAHHSSSQDTTRNFTHSQHLHNHAPSTFSATFSSSTTYSSFSTRSRNKLVPIRYISRNGGIKHEVVSIDQTDNTIDSITVADDPFPHLNSSMATDKLNPATPIVDLMIETYKEEKRLYNSVVNSNSNSKSVMSDSSQTQGIQTTTTTTTTTTSSSSSSLQQQSNAPTNSPSQLDRKLLFIFLNTRGSEKTPMYTFMLAPENQFTLIDLARISNLHGLNGISAEDAQWLWPKLGQVGATTVDSISSSSTCAVNFALPYFRALCPDHKQIPCAELPTDIPHPQRLPHPFIDPNHVNEQFNNLVAQIELEKNHTVPKDTALLDAHVRATIVGNTVNIPANLNAFIGGVYFIHFKE